MKRSLVKNKKKGFTLIELIIVIAVLAILVGIAVPNFIGISRKAKVKADEVSLELLNRATTLYSIGKKIKDEDIFGSVFPAEDEARMNLLLNEGLLDEPIKPQQKDKTFSWNIDEQVWKLISFESGGQIPDEGGEEEVQLDYTAYNDAIAFDEFLKYSVPSWNDYVLARDNIKNDIEDKKEQNTIVQSDIDTAVTDILAAKQNLKEVLILTADEAENTGFTFSNGTITNYDKSKGKNVVIPYRIDGVVVTAIGNNTFKNAPLTLPKDKIESVSIPDSVTTIGESAFENNLLTSVTIPSSVTSIGSYSFKSNRLTEVTIPNSVTSIASQAFYANGYISGEGILPPQVTSPGTWKIVNLRWKKQ